MARILLNLIFVFLVCLAHAFVGVSCFQRAGLNTTENLVWLLNYASLVTNFPILLCTFLAARIYHLRCTVRDEFANDTSSESKEARCLATGMVTLLIHWFCSLTFLLAAYISGIPMPFKNVERIPVFIPYSIISVAIAYGATSIGINRLIEKLSKNEQEQEQE